MALQQMRFHGRDVLHAADVAGAPFGAEPLVAQGLRHGLAFVRLAAADDDMGAGLRQHARGPQAYALGRAGDQRHLAAEVKRVGAHRPVQTGLRFSLNDASPSMASSVMASSAIWLSV